MWVMWALADKQNKTEQNSRGGRWPPISIGGDKEMSICERHRKALQVPVGNPLSVGWGVVLFRAGGVTKVPLALWSGILWLWDGDFTSPSDFHSFLPTPSLCPSNPFPSALLVKCSFPHWDFHVVVKECVVCLIARLVSCYGIFETPRLFLYDCQKYWTRPKKCVLSSCKMSEGLFDILQKNVLCWGFKYSLTNPWKRLEAQG